MKTCKYDGCLTLPTYGIKGGSGKDAKYCNNHKPIGYVDVKHKTCKYDGCLTRPTYGIKGGSIKMLNTVTIINLLDMLMLEIKRVNTRGG